MAIAKKGRYYYGDSQSDLQEIVLDYSDYNKYKIDHFRDAVCSCGNKTRCPLFVGKITYIDYGKI